MIEIMKASAGSGKTYNLAKKYIRILLESDNRTEYRNILAVTFTNKATDEMKSRIIKELDVLARDPSESPYYDEFVQLPKMHGKGLQAKSNEILCNILHDYSAFSVSTIDKFFQRTLKAFSKEIGQFASYQVELDKDSLVTESVDRILDSLTEKDTKMLKWLTDDVHEQLLSNGQFSLDQGLYNTAKSIKTDSYRDLVERYGIDEKKVFSKENLENIRIKCQELVKRYKSRLSDAANKVLEVMKSAGVDPSQSNRQFLCVVENYSDPDMRDPISMPTPSFLTKAADCDQWFTKASAPSFLPLLAGKLDGPLTEFCKLFEEEFNFYNTAILIKDQIYELGIVRELNEQFAALMKEKNVLSIDDSNHILKNIIDGSDTPFIYEKIGVRFEHFLLDEFQDTSNVQWANFQPLLADSNASGNYNMVVGDVKQSIYRWRGSDWNLLKKEIVKQFPEHIDNPLASNFRSLRNIVEFNNGFYPFAAQMLDAANKPGSSVISDIYSDVRQNVSAKDPALGNVDIIFADKDIQEASILSEIAKVKDAGGKYGDIAIIVRTNGVGSGVATLLIDNKIPVVSDDSLDVKSSVTVRRLASLLSYANNPKDTLNAALAAGLGIETPANYHSLIDLCEELLRGLKSYDSELFKGDVTYIQSFMDDLQDWVSINGNSLADFLKYWDGANPKISSPEGLDAVRIITIHKAKGLAFPYVIFPYAQKVETFPKSSYMRPIYNWCYPRTEGTEMDFAKGIYRVELTSNQSYTLFNEDYEREQEMQFIDSLNTFYVATTRAEKGMSIIALTPSKKCVEACKNNDVTIFDFKDISEILYWYSVRKGLDLRFEHSKVSDRNGSTETFKLGSRYDFTHLSRVTNDGFVALEADYPSIPLNTGKERLSFNKDSVDFFSDGEAGVEASTRIRGIVLHNILSKVIVPDDLDGAIEAAFLKGEINEDEKARIKVLLAKGIEDAKARGWFPDDPSYVRNEASLLDTDGQVYRPDRVIFSDNGVIIVDYKFAEQKESYLRQIGRYAAIYRRMGYYNVSATLWYVDSGEVVNSSELF